MTYEYKPQARIKAPAGIAGAICQQLERTGGLTPKRLLDASRDETAPLHKEFEWDDTVAAEGFREQQSAYIIRNIVVRVAEDQKKPVRAFFNVVNADDRAYQSLDVIIANPVLRNQLLDSALSELRALRDKYESLCELKPVFSAIDRLRLPERSQECRTTTNAPTAE